MGKSSTYTGLCGAQKCTWTHPFARASLQETWALDLPWRWTTQSKWWGVWPLIFYRPKKLKLLSTITAPCSQLNLGKCIFNLAKRSFTVSSIFVNYQIFRQVCLAWVKTTADSVSLFSPTQIHILESVHSSHCIISILFTKLHVWTWMTFMQVIMSGVVTNQSFTETKQT